MYVYKRIHAYLVSDRRKETGRGSEHDDNDERHVWDTKSLGCTDSCMYVCMYVCIHVQYGRVCVQVNGKQSSCTYTYTHLQLIQQRSFTLRYNKDHLHSPERACLPYTYPHTHTFRYSTRGTLNFFLNTHIKTEMHYTSMSIHVHHTHNTYQRANVNQYMRLYLHIHTIWAYTWHSPTVKANDYIHM
jgi:hypothetical protein